MNEQMASPYLMAGERISWLGRPGGGIRLSPQDGMLIPFSLVWCGFTIFWEATVLRQHTPGIFPLFGAMFVAIGLYFVAGRFLADAWVRSRTAYFLTDRRALIVGELFSTSVRSVSLTSAPEMHLIQKADGSGSIRFGAIAQTRSAIGGTRSMAAMTPTLDGTPQFLYINDVRRVFDLIQKQSILA